MTLRARLRRPACLASLVGLAFLLLAAPVNAQTDDPPTSTSTETASPSPTATPTPTASETPTATETETPTQTSSSGTATETETPTATETPGAPTATLTESPSPSVTSTPSLTPAATAFPPLAVLIHEVAWAGTLASANDEWIELYNNTGAPIDLAGWRLTDGGDITVHLSGTLPAFSFLLLERTDDSTVADIPADQIYTGALNNDGEGLILFDPSGARIDSANLDGGAWPAGEAGSRASMERLGGDDRSGNWATFSGSGGVGHDAAGQPIAGTPRTTNSPFAATATPVAPPTPAAPQSILINEIAWAGTHAASADEWVELHNPGTADIELTGWRLTDGGDISVTLVGFLPAGSYLLLERSDDATVADIPADRIFSGGLNNAGETLRLYDGTGALIDTANADGGSWPAGSASSRASMERRGGDDRPGNWGTFTGYNGVGRDAAGNAIPGTPRSANSLLSPTPQPTWIPGRIVINEVLIRPHYDWEGAGGVTTADEFIELHNLGPFRVRLHGFVLDDVPEAGSSPYVLPDVVLQPGGFLALFRSQTHIALNDSGDSVRLLDRDGNVLDEIRYLRVRAYNLSYGRLPDGSSRMRYGLWPTPGQANLLFVEPTPIIVRSLDCPQGGLPQPRLPRLTRHPALARWMGWLGLAVCR